MDRLTYWNEDYECWAYRCPSGDAAIRLHEYENTDITPQEIEELKRDNARLKDTVSTLFKTVETLNITAQILTKNKDKAVDLWKNEQKGNAELRELLVFELKKSVGKCNSCYKEFICTSKKGTHTNCYSHINQDRLDKALGNEVTSDGD